MDSEGQTPKTFNDGIVRCGHVKCNLCPEKGKVTLNEDIAITPDMFKRYGWMQAIDSRTNAPGWICPKCANRYAGRTQIRFTDFKWSSPAAQQAYESIQDDKIH